jgi:hypothetical protein
MGFWGARVQGLVVRGQGIRVEDMRFWVWGFRVWVEGTEN